VIFNLYWRPSITNFKKLKNKTKQNKNKTQTKTKTQKRHNAYMHKILLKYHTIIY
jgi:hypothetical protein